MTTTSTQERIADGIHKGLTRREYESIEAVNQSILKHFAKTPAHAREYMIHPPEPTDAMNFGSALHCALLEPKRFETAYVVPPKFDRRTKEGKDGWAQWENENRGKEILGFDEMEAIKTMAANCYNDPVAKSLLTSPGSNEVAVVWTDKKSGLRCKALLDRVTSCVGYTVVVDIKSARDASELEFGRAVFRLGYHVQAAFYLEGLRVLAPSDRRFFFVAVEKVPPYCVALYELDDEAIRQGRALVRRYLDTYAECMATGVWPGYPSGVSPLSLPSWATEIGGENGDE